MVFQAVIKSAASAASPKTNIEESRESTVAGPAVRMPSRCLLASLDSWIFVFGEAALAAVITEKKPSGEAAPPADFITASSNSTKTLSTHGPWTNIFSTGTLPGGV